MRTIPKERILRVNCAGYGTEAHWNLGRAKSLNNYSAIIVNPVSIAHLFDKDPELVRKVEQCLQEGTTTLNIDDDLLLRNLAAEIDSRVLELSDFLTQGGVLVYFLCRPFVIQGPSLALDNYYWLESLAPDQPAERNVRHMSAVSHGRLIEPTEDGSISEFAPYLQQHGLEWSTLIRAEYLTEGYSALAEAGARKCIAGQLFIVESSGKVVFLPSPYSPDFDKTLIECLNNWYEQKEQSPEELESERMEASALAAVAAQPAPQTTGTGLFDRDQKEYEPVASAELETAPAANFDDGFTINADEIAATVSQEARIFEQEVASKKTVGNIDLSIFAQTARQLVQKATQEVEIPAAVTAVEEPPPPPPPPPPVVDEAPSYALPPDDVVAPEPPVAEAPTSTGAHSLRNVLSNAAPLLPESVKPDLHSNAQEVYAEQEEQAPAAPQAAEPEPQPAPPPAVSPKTVTSLFNDDDFDDIEPVAQAAEIPEPSVVESGIYTAPVVESSTVESGVYSTRQVEPPPIDSGVYSVQQIAAPSMESGAFAAQPQPAPPPQPEPEPEPPVNSGVYAQPQVEAAPPPPQPEPVVSQDMSNSGVFSQPQLESPVVAPPEPAPAAPLPPPPPPPQAEAPPPAESNILQPPSGFMTNFGAQGAPPAVENPAPQEQPMAQPTDHTLAPAGDSSVTNNDDPSNDNDNNKSTMDLLRELEKAQRPQQPAPATMTVPPPAPPAGDAARPLLNNLFKKDAPDAPAMEQTPPAVPPAPPPVVQQQAPLPPPPPVPTRNTLGALAQPAAAQVPQQAPQEPVSPMINREGYNVMTNMNVPDWCTQYSFSYLDELKKEQSGLASQLQDVQAKLNTVESKIASVEQLKCALLAGDGEALKEACGLVLGRLGWTINHNNASPNEVLLLNVDQPEALVRIVRSDAHCDRSEVAQVSGSAIAFWEKHDVEPKGLLIACTWSNVSPLSRNQRDFEEPVAEFAKKKSLCLITTLQLIGIYRDLELGLVTQDVVRRQMLETNGCLQGYAVEAGGMVGARA